MQVFSKTLLESYILTSHFSKQFMLLQIFSFPLWECTTNLCNKGYAYKDELKMKLSLNLQQWQFIYIFKLSKKNLCEYQRSFAILVNCRIFSSCLYFIIPSLSSWCLTFNKSSYVLGSVLNVLHVSNLHELSKFYLPLSQRN